MKLDKKTKRILNIIGLIVGIAGVLIALYGLLYALGLL